MRPTPDRLTLFAQPADLITYYDSRRVRELASDSGTPVPLDEVPENRVIITMLARATEMVLSACRQGERYTEEELDLLCLYNNEDEDNDPDTSDDDAGTPEDEKLNDDWGSMLRGLVCDLAFGLLVMRRGTGAADLDRLSPAFKAAQYTLSQLAAGALIFPRIDGDAHADAGTPRTADLTQQTTSPTLSCSWSRQASSALLPNSPVTNPYCC